MGAAKAEKVRPRKQAAGAGTSVDLAVLSIRSRAARCRVLASGETVVLRSSDLWDLVPGEIATVMVRKSWSYGGNPYLAGDIESTRLDVPALSLTPLRLSDCGVWDPAEHYWGEEGRPIDSWAKPIIARGAGREHEMEQVLPGEDLEDPLLDPILEANELKDMGNAAGAREILMELCRADLRCLDAHAHLGNLIFEARPIDAVRHYAVGFRIGELSLGPDFEGLLPWGWVNNRPFLRCMHGYGLCLWRLERFDEALQTFDRMLWLNPSDNQGVRFLLRDVRRKTRWNNSDQV